MSSPAIPLSLRRDALRTRPAEASERRVRRRVGITWALLILSLLTFYPRTWTGLPLAFPIPSTVGKLITQGALPAALLVALSVNRRILVRPNVFLCLVSLLVIEAFMLILQAQHFGTVYRTFPFAGFVATLWLLSPWWGRRDLLFVPFLLATVSGVLGTVLLGALIAPKTAYGQHRLAGSLWPIPPPHVPHFPPITVD